MSNRHYPEIAEASGQTGPPLSLQANIALGSEEVSEAVRGFETDPPKMRARELLALFLAQLTVFMALVVPMAFSLAIKIGVMDPENKDTLLAVAIGTAGTVVLFTNPITGVLSDRTRSRLGRRRPWFFGGLIVGTVGSVIIGLSASPLVLIAGWTVALAGYSMSNQAILTYLGDRLPESQRGKVMGVSGAITQVGPILGIVLAGVFTSHLLLMFLIPAGIALLGSLWFTVAMKDTKFEGELPAFRLASLTRGFYFNPRKHSNFAWVILSKAFIFVYLAFTALYALYLLMSRFELDAPSAAPLISIISLGGIVLGIVGAIGGGILSDKLHSRKPFLIISAVLLAASAVIVGTSADVAVFIVGSLLSSLGIGIYGSVDQALALDTLPSQENENGRYLSIFGLANAIPQAVGPFLAALVLSLAGGDYTWVYFVGAGAAVLGALAIIPISVGRRALLSTTSVRAIS
ncbi:MFS transporter [Agromyces albus]|uniref:MFS transporter n=1 Tax=Agromyces albus TaxID=205332 RepID=A0A4Q2KRI4_9MICO|nr:MFS transporter [Agromyces albus]RXZ68055.1 MFS transporter [Agromyces albus]